MERKKRRREGNRRKVRSGIKKKGVWGVRKEGRRKGMAGDKAFSWDSLKGSMDVAHGKKI